MPKLESFLHRSNYYVAGNIILLFINLVIISSLPFVLWIKLILGIGTGAYTCYLIHRQLQWQAIGQDEDGWYLIKDNKKISFVPLDHTVITSFVVLLRFTHHKPYLFKQSCLIFKDAVPHDFYRELVMRMRYFR